MDWLRNLRTSTETSLNSLLIQIFSTKRTTTQTCFEGKGVVGCHDRETSGITVTITFMKAIASQIIKSITQTRIDHILGSKEDALSRFPEVSANENREGKNKLIFPLRCFCRAVLSRAKLSQDDNKEKKKAKQLNRAKLNVAERKLKENSS